MKIILSRDEKIELLQAMKLGIWDTTRTPNLCARLKGLPNIGKEIPVLTDEDIQKIIEINNELKKKKSI